MNNNLLTMLDANVRPVAVLKFERGTPGRENEMPRVVSCNWMPDGEYEVYLAAAPTTQPSPKQEVHQPGAAYAALPMSTAMHAIDGVTACWPSDLMHAFADATCALRATPAQFARGFEAAKAQFAAHGQAPAQAEPAAVAGPDEIDRLRAALVYVAFALHNTRQYMLAEGVTLIDGDTVRVSRDGWTVEASSNPLRQPATQPSPAAQGDALDAARWRALLACGRIRIIGTAGVTGTGVHDPKALDLNKQPYGNYVHFGAEFWSTFPDQDYYNTKENPAYARATLTEFADAARKQGATQ